MTFVDDRDDWKASLNFVGSFTIEKHHFKCRTFRTQFTAQICVYVCRYIYIYTFVHRCMYRYTYIYMYIYVCIPSNRNLSWMDVVGNLGFFHPFSLGCKPSDVQSLNSPFLWFQSQVLQINPDVFPNFHKIDCYVNPPRNVDPFPWVFPIYVAAQTTHLYHLFHSSCACACVCVCVCGWTPSIPGFNYHCCLLNIRVFISLTKIIAIHPYWLALLANYGILKTLREWNVVPLVDVYSLRTWK